MLDLRRLRLLRELQRARDDRRGRRRAAVHAVGRLAAARHARARGRRAAARARRPRRAAHRRGARARRATPTRCSSARRWRRPTSPRPPGRSRAARGSRASSRSRCGSRCRRCEALAPRRAAPALRAASRPSPRRRCPRSRSATSTSCSATSGSTSRACCPRAWSATSCCSDPVRLVLPARHPAARRHADAVPLAELAGDAWATGHAGMGWDEMTRRTCRELGGFEPDIRHRTNDAGDQPRARRPGPGGGDAARPGAARPPARDQRCATSPTRTVSRAIFAATRAADAARPSTQAVLAAVREAATR